MQVQAHVRVRRHLPESGGTFFKDYTVEVAHYETVLDALIKIREEQDGTLALRCSCRSAICGSCALRINGESRLACKTRVTAVRRDGEPITVEPMGNLPVVKDLVVDMRPFWGKVRAVDPWLQPAGPPPEQEYVVPNEAMLHLAEVMNCIMCGACVSACTALEAELKQGRPIDDTFLGPAALAKAYRFVADPRDAAGYPRLDALSGPHGMWDCTRCFYCVEVCPKGVAPMERILGLRARGIEAGITDHNGVRHSEAFLESVHHSGRLNEFTLYPKSVGWFNVKEMLSLLPGALRMVLRRKMPSPVHPAIPGIERVRRLIHRHRAERRAREAPKEAVR